MTLAITTMPADPRDWPRWLDEQLVGDRLGDVVDEFNALGTSQVTGSSLNEMLGSHREDLLARGTAAIPEPVRRQLLGAPAHLLELQEMVLLEGGPYWEALPRPRRLVEMLEQSRGAILSSIQPTQLTGAEPARPVLAKRELLRWAVSFATTACLLVAGVLIWQGTRPPTVTSSNAVAWGWAKPGALPQSATASEYYEALAQSGEQWFKQRPSDRAEVAKRVNELRQGCSVLLVSDHPPLSADQSRDLKDRCRKWATQFDAALVKLETGSDPVEVRTEIDGVVQKLITYLNSQRNV